MSDFEPSGLQNDPRGPLDCGHGPSSGSVELVGPFERWDVVVDGRLVPYLQATPEPGGVVHLTLDGRFGLVVEVADLDRTARFVADCIAVGMGYTCHPPAEWDEPIRNPPFPRMRCI